MNGPRRAGDIKPAAYNPRIISKDRLRVLGQAMKEFGDLGGLVVNIRTGNLISGHQRLKHLDPAWAISKAPIADETGTVALGTVETPFGSISYREVNWPKSKEVAANIAANEHGGEFDYKAVSELLHTLDNSIDMNLLGFDDSILKSLLDGTHEGIPQPEPDGKGMLLEKLKVTIKDPKTKVELGQVWKAGKHLVVCADVFTEWPRWVPLLAEGCLCLPYAGPFVLLTERAKQQACVVVNPDPYICGHILDSFKQVYGEEVHVAK